MSRVMALAEARAAWQRTANRCFVQEDAKRAPRLACCSSLTSSDKPDETPPTNATTVQDIPTSNYSPFNQTPSHPNLSPSSRWWLQLQPNYTHQMDLMGEQVFISRECNEDDSLLVDQTSHVENHYQNFIASADEKFGSVYYQKSGDAAKIGCEVDVKEVRDEEVLGSFEVLKKFDDISFDSESSWVGVEKNTPWWRTADAEELALVVAQRSHGLIENCDLPMPQNTRVKKNLRSNGRSLSHDEMMTSLPVRKTSIGSNHSFLSEGSSCLKLRVLAEDQLLSPNKPLRDSQSHKMKLEMHASDVDTSKAQLLEALRHSQTRAREAEEVAKQACAEKEHVVKLLFRQASELFAYKQWLQLLQLENMYLQFINNEKSSASSVFSKILPPRNRKSWPKSSRQKRAKRGRPRYDFGRYAIVFALGLGIIGAGLFLGWMLPIW
ncbi:hypothetical protein ACS0TY_002332 [Phlomoides rotata]